MKLFLTSPIHDDEDLAVFMNTKNATLFLEQHQSGYIGTWLGWDDEVKKRHPVHWFIIGGKIIQVIEEV